MDVFVEQLVKKKADITDLLAIVGIIVLGIAIVVFCMMIPFVAQFEVLILAGVIFGVYYFITSRNLEYEYSTTNGDFTVDKIINRRSRQRLCHFDLHNVEEMGRYDAAVLQNKACDKRLNTSADKSGTDVWYLIVRIQDQGKTLVIFSPNEKVLAAMKSYLPRQVSVNAYRGY